MSPEGIKTTRRRIHGIITSLEEHDWGADDVAFTMLYLHQGRMWLGEALGELGGMQNPDPDSLNPANEKVAPATDTDPLDGQGFYPPDGSRIKYVKELRATLVEISERIRQELMTGSRERFYQFALTNALSNLVSARMWLGQALSVLAKERSG